jgi:hypothetical protein
MKYDPNQLPSHQQREAAKRIVCALIQEAGNTFNGKTRLYKAFYWAHLHYWQHHDGVLTAYPIARMPYGPGIDRGEDLLFEMQCQHLIRIESSGDPDFPEQVFRLVADFPINLTDDERESVRHGLAKVESRSGKQASADAHQQSRNWQRLPNGKIMNIYEDLLPEAEVERSRLANTAIKALLDQTLGQV